MNAQQPKPTLIETPAETHPVRLRSYQSAWLADYVPLIGAPAVERIAAKAEPLGGLGVQQINSTKHGGGVAEILRSLTPMLSGLGIRTHWVSLAGSPAFFDVTKKIHNLLQGDAGDLTDDEWRLYLDTVAENAEIIDVREDVIVVHDPQVLPLVEYRNNHHRRWIWRCHLDLSNTNHALWGRLRPLVDQYDDVIFTLPEYDQPIKPRLHYIMPAIDPFTIKNRPVAQDEIDTVLAHYNIPRDLPIVAQVSRFDPWKDPVGVIQAARQARKQVGFTLVLLGNMATDDPEGRRIYETLVAEADDRTLIVPEGDDQLLVNAIQTTADAIVQKSLREGFGLTVTEAMWKGRPIVAGNVGGIRHQITDGENGLLVDTPGAAADAIVRVLTDPALAARLGAAARETVCDRFLFTRLLEDHLDLLTPPA
jgi:trehalose synthase